MIKRLFSLALPRFIRFRKEVMLLWRALWAPTTPLYLKAATVFAVLYLVTPVDLIPDIIPVIGWVDDIILVPLMVSWIVSRLPVPAYTSARTDGPTIDGTARERY